MLNLSCMFKKHIFFKADGRDFVAGGRNFCLSSKDAQGAEEREALARMAANVEDAASADSEAYIEKYLRSVLAVENILTLDRLRQVWF